MPADKIYRDVADWPLDEIFFLLSASLKHSITCYWFPHTCKMEQGPREKTECEVCSVCRAPNISTSVWDGKTRLPLCSACIVKPASAVSYLRYFVAIGGPYRTIPNEFQATVHALNTASFVGKWLFRGIVLAALDVDHVRRTGSITHDRCNCWSPERSVALSFLEGTPSELVAVVLRVYVPNGDAGVLLDATCVMLDPPLAHRADHEVILLPGTRRVESIEEVSDTCVEKRIKRQRKMKLWTFDD